MLKNLKASFALLAIFSCLNSVSYAAAMSEEEITAQLAASGGAVFPIGTLNSANAPYFTGTSYVAWCSPQ